MVRSVDYCDRHSKRQCGSSPGRRWRHMAEAGFPPSQLGADSAARKHQDHAFAFASAFGGFAPVLFVVALDIAVLPRDFSAMSFGALVAETRMRTLWDRRRGGGHGRLGWWTPPGLGPPFLVICRTLTAALLMSAASPREPWSTHLLL